VPGSSEAAIGRARARERLARRRLAGLAALTAIGVLLTTRPGTERFGALLTGFAVAVGMVEVGAIAFARGRARRAADELIDAGFVVRPGNEAREFVDNRLRELGAEPSRRGMAKALRGALADASRPRSSNPLILAGRSIVLRRGTALALLAERELVLRIVRELPERPADPRAILALRNLLYPQSTGPVAVDDQERDAQLQLHRIASLLDLPNRDAPAEIAPQVIPDRPAAQA
jgi:hypothetical protein